MESNQLAIVIPAFNEEKTIGGVVSKVRVHGIVIVVDDGSTDRTASIASSSGAIVVNQKNLGYDAAIDSGFRKAFQLGCNYCLTMDADGQHDTNLVENFKNKLQEYDLVLGYRPKTQRFSEFLFSLVTRIKFGVKDPLCGMKGYHMRFFKKLGHFDSYQSIGTEMLLFALRSKTTFTQIPVPRIDRADAPRFGKVVRANLIILKSMFSGLVLKRFELIR